MHARGLFTIWVFFLLANASFAGIGEYNFDSASTDSFISMRCGSGDLSRAGSPYQISSISGRPPQFGTWSLSPFNNPTSNTSYVLDFTFEPPTSFSVDMGDFDADADTLSLKAYSGSNGTGTLLATATATLPAASGFNYLTLKVQSTGIRSVVFIGGSPGNPNSVYYDNFKTTVAPNGTGFEVTTDSTAFADFTIFRPSNGGWYTWFWLNMPPSTQGLQFGINGDKPITGDFDGNRISDVGVFRDGTWYIFHSFTNAIRIVQFGSTGDLPLSADFDNDGKTDIAVFRPSNGVWYWLNSSTDAFSAIAFGQNGDVPRPGNFDRDGKADLAVFRPGTGAWYIGKSSNGSVSGVTFGASGDVPVPADYDGDSLTDIAVFRNGIWYRINSSNGQVNIQQFGSAGDIPVPAEYASCTEIDLMNGQANIAVWRPSNGAWYCLVNNNVCIRSWGAAGDVPISLISN